MTCPHLEPARRPEIAISVTAGVGELFSPPPGPDAAAMRLSLAMPEVVQGLYSTMAGSTAGSEVLGADAS